METESPPRLSSQLPCINDLPLGVADARFFQEMEAMVIKKTQDEYRDQKPTKGFWAPREDDLLRQAVMKTNPIVWDTISEAVPGRTPIQCKERWLYRLHPSVKKSRFEKWEDELIIRERARIGNHWTLIANRLPGRTSCAVKNRWYSVLRNHV